MALAVALAMALAVALAVALALARSKNLKVSKVLRMGLPIVENLSGPCAIIFSLFKIRQLRFNLKSQNWLNYSNSPDITRGAPLAKCAAPRKITPQSSESEDVGWLMSIFATRIFSSFKSRCTTPCSWQNLSASVNCTAM